MSYFYHGLPDTEKYFSQQNLDCSVFYVCSAEMKAKRAKTMRLSILKKKTVHTASVIK